MHGPAKAGAAFLVASALASCAHVSPGQPNAVAHGDGTAVVVLRPVDSSGKLAHGWQVRPIRGNLAMSCSTAQPSPYAVDAGVGTGCSPNSDHTLACWLVTPMPGTLCLTEPFDPKKRFVVQFPNALHGPALMAPSTPVPIALELDNGIRCSPVTPDRYRCANGLEATRDDGRWATLPGNLHVATTYYLGVDAGSDARI
ncbi:hypothetical protein [Smaragdicoccus niigatensis]|uniref:hypothetical protein n=1 Tax=Smaragdicoccus niigatensis TaxID=359359 RepID=UPI0003793C42|nr:hypothetical protein [Smaragdicoccus niigatensis]